MLGGPSGDAAAEVGVVGFENEDGIDCGIDDGGAGVGLEVRPMGMLDHEAAAAVGSGFGAAGWEEVAKGSAGSRLFALPLLPLPACRSHQQLTTPIA